MKFNTSRLISIRSALGLNKAEAARKLNLSAMGYGRYESGEREPSFQTVSFIAQTFGTTTDYLYGLSDNMSADTLTISQSDDPELFQLVMILKKEDDLSRRLLEYYTKLKNT